MMVYVCIICIHKNVKQNYSTVHRVRIERSETQELTDFEAVTEKGKKGY